jgi:hypothetical protein
MKKQLLSVTAVILILHAAVHAIGTIKEVRLADGYNNDNRVSSPVFDAGGVPPINVTIRQAFDRSAKIVRRGATGFFTKGPEYNLDKGVDLGAIFTEAIRSEANAMGIRTSSAAEAGWQVDGTIKDVYLESKQIPYGATLFYGYIDLDVKVASAKGAAQSRPMRFHHYYGGYNAGLGRKDEAAEALASLLVEGAQAAVSRLNREFFKAAPRADVEAKLGQLRAGAPLGNTLHVVGLSGAPSAVPALLALLTSEADENRRSELINALANLGSRDAVDPLVSRYATEDEDCRWYILKAMDYIGGDAALNLVKGPGLKDTDGGPRRLAQRIAQGS